MLHAATCENATDETVVCVDRSAEDTEAERVEAQRKLMADALKLTAVLVRLFCWSLLRYRRLQCMLSCAGGKCINCIMRMLMHLQERTKMIQGAVEGALAAVTHRTINIIGEINQL